MKTIGFLLFAQLSLLGLVVSCGKTILDTPSVEGSSFLNVTPTHYFQVTQRIVVEVYYEAGAEPFTGLWNILEDNLNAIFQYRTTKPVLIIPKVIPDMTLIPEQGKSTWTPEEVLNLNASFKKGRSTESEAHFYIYFLKGNAKDSNSVIAFSIKGTPVIGVFKDVIKNSGGPIVQNYVEQSTLVHEMGHGLGLVNDGIPMKTPHLDLNHGSHTTNTNCVMYWQNEGLSHLMTYVQKYITSNSKVMWGAEVLSDAQAFSK